MNIESVFLEVKRVLAPGGVFLFTEEPLRRLLSLRIYRTPYQDRMKPWERKLFDWGLLGYLARDVIGAEQEESFGIRQNHKMYLRDWRRLITKHFAAQRYQVFVPERGFGERIVKRAVFSDWRAASLLGGTLAAMCRKAGEGPDLTNAVRHRAFDAFEEFLRCPDCHGDLSRDASGTLVCACGYRAPSQGGVACCPPLCAPTLSRQPRRRDRFSLPAHAAHLREGWYGVEATPVTSTAGSACARCRPAAVQSGPATPSYPRLRAAAV
jgi:hypothetical protein